MSTVLVIQPELRGRALIYGDTFFRTPIWKALLKSYRIPSRGSQDSCRFNDNERVIRKLSTHFFSPFSSFMAFKILV